MREITRLVAVLATVCAALEGSASAQEAEARVELNVEPQIDVAVITNLRVSPSHTKAYAEQMARMVERCLGGLVAPGGTAIGAPPKDGSARYRLYVEHAGTAAVSPALSTEDLKHQDDVYAKFLTSQQKGTFQFRLARWTGSAYRDVDRWTSSFVRTHYVPADRNMTRDELSALREHALMRTMPEDLDEALLGHILPIRIAEARGLPGQTKNCTVIVQNRSLWPLKKLSATIRWPDEQVKNQYRYEMTVAYVGLLMPGKQTTLTGTGKSVRHDFRFQYAAPMEIEASPLFDPSRGPEFVRSQIEVMRKGSADQRQSAADALMALASSLEPEEANAAEGLLELLAIDNPKSEADLHAGALAVLARFGDKAAPLLLEGLKHPSAGVRLGVLCVIAQRRTADKVVLARLRDLAREKNEVVRAAAVRALEACGQAVPPAPGAPAGSALPSAG